MTKVSRRPLKKEVEDRLHKIFLDVIKSLHSDEEIENFLHEFLSPVERVMLSKRLAIAVLLSKGHTYPAIAEILHVTPSTIAQVSLQLKYSGKGYKKVVDRLLHTEDVRDFTGKIDDFFASLEPKKYYDPDYILSGYEKRQRERKKPF